MGEFVSKHMQYQGLLAEVVGHLKQVFCHGPWLVGKCWLRPPSSVVSDAPLMVASIEAGVCPDMHVHACIVSICIVWCQSVPHTCDLARNRRVRSGPSVVHEK